MPQCREDYIPGGRACEFDPKATSPDSLVAFLTDIYQRLTDSHLFSAAINCRERLFPHRYSWRLFVFAGLARRIGAQKSNGPSFAKPLEEALGMSDDSQLQARDPSPKPFAVVLGVNEVASATAVFLNRNGWGVVLSHDPSPPVLRRGMSFHDALFGDRAAIDEVVGEGAETGLEVLAALACANTVAVTPLGLLDLLVLRNLDLIVDARLQEPAQRPHLKNLAALTIGLGPGFAAGIDCDVALPVRSGKGAFAVAGDADERGRFVYADRSGLWQTAVDLGLRAFQRLVVGHVSGAPVSAAIDGILVGVVRDGTEVIEGDILAELEPRIRQATWTGMDKAGRATARAVMRAINAAFSEPSRRARTKRLTQNIIPEIDRQD